MIIKKYTNEKQDEINININDYRLTKKEFIEKYNLNKDNPKVRFIGIDYLLVKKYKTNSPLKLHFRALSTPDHIKLKNAKKESDKWLILFHIMNDNNKRKGKPPFKGPQGTKNTSTIEKEFENLNTFYDFSKKNKITKNDFIHTLHEEGFCILKYKKEKYNTKLAKLIEEDKMIFSLEFMNGEFLKIEFYSKQNKHDLKKENTSESIYIILWKFNEKYGKFFANAIDKIKQTTQSKNN